MSFLSRFGFKKEPEKKPAVKTEQPQDRSYNKEQTFAGVRFTEQKIINQREDFTQKLKTKEEELVLTSMQLENIEGKINTEKKQNEAEYKKAENEFRGQINKVENEIAQRNKEWESRVKAKDKDIDAIKNVFQIESSKLKYELDQKKNEIEIEIEGLQRQLQILENRLKEENEMFLSKIQAGENKVVSLKTQIALKDAHRRAESDSNSLALRDLKEKLIARLKQEESRLEKQLQEWEQKYRSKENELIAFKASMQQQQSDVTLSFESELNKLKSQQQALTARMDSLKARIAEEEVKSEKLLKDKDAEINKVKIELMLKDSQEKNEHESRKALIQEETQRIEKQIEELGNKLLNEKENYIKILQAKEQEVEALKIQHELRISELKKEWEKKQKDIYEEKTNLENELKALDEKLAQEKSQYDEILAAKNLEMEAIKTNWAEKQKIIKLQFEEEVKKLRTEKLELDGKAADLRQNAVKEKEAWEKLLKDKDIEIQVNNRDNLLREDTYKKEFDVFVKDLRDKQLPLRHRINGLNQRIDELKARCAHLVNEKDMLISSLKEQAAQDESRIKSSYEHKKTEISKEKEALISAIDVLNKQIDEFKAQAEQQVEEREAQLEKLKEVFSEKAHEFERAKLHKTVEFERECKALEEEITALEKQYQAENSNTAEVLKSKETEVDSFREKCSKQEKYLKDRYSELNNSWLLEKTKFDADVEHYRKKVEEARVIQSRRIQEKSAELQKLQQDLKGREEGLKNELTKIEGDITREKEPLHIQRDTLTSKINELKKKGAEEINVREGVIAQLKQKLAGLDLTFEKIYKEREKSITEEKEKYQLELKLLQSEIAGIRSSTEQSIFERNHQIKLLNDKFSEEFEKFSNQQKAIHENWSKLRDELSSQIDILKAELHTMEFELPALLQQKEAEKLTLSEKIRDTQELVEKKRENVAHSISKFKRRAENLIKEARKNYELEKVKLEEQIKQKEQELEQAKLKFDEEKQSVIDKITEESKLYTQKRVELEQEKTGLEETIRTLKAQSNEKIRAVEKLIFDLNHGIAHKKELWQDEEKELNAQFEAEKESLNAQLKNLRAQFESERSSIQSLITEKEKQIQGLQLEHEKKYRELTYKQREQIDTETEAIKKLENEISSLSAVYDSTKSDFEKRINENESKLEEVQGVFNELKRKVDNERERHQLRYEQEKSILQADINKANDTVDKERNEYINLLKAKEIQCVANEKELTDREEKLKRQWMQGETQLLEKKDALQFQMEELTKKYNEEKSAWDKTLKSISSQIDKTKFSLAVKNSERDAQKSKFDHEIRKVQMELANEISSVKHRFEKERESWVSRIRQKNDEINVLSTRFSMRQTRIEGEYRRRQAELQDVVARFEQEIRDISAKYAGESSAVQQLQAEKAQTLAELRTQMENLEKGWEERKGTYVKFKKEDMDKSNLEIGRIESEISELTDRLKNLLDKKEKHVEFLKDALLEKDKELNFEFQQTQKTGEFLKNRIESIRQGPSAQEKKDRALSELLERGTKLFNNGEWVEAVKAFEEIKSMDSELVFTHEYLAMCFAKMGSLKQAVESANKALSLDPKNKRIKELLNKLSRDMGRQ